MWGLKFARIGLLFAVMACVSGCWIIPTSGPSEGDIRAGRPLEPDGQDYALVRLTPDAVNVLAKYEPSGLAGVFTDRTAPASIVFGIGDVVSVSIFEAAAGGLFIPSEAGVRPGNFVTLPSQPIDDDGNITVPYAGDIRAAGRTARDVQQAIVDAIRNRAIEPQAVVALTEQRTSLISVLGEVNNPLRFPAAASGAGDRVLDAITRAGGIKGQGYETWVMLERKGRRKTVPFENLVSSPSNNIYVQPGDRIYVYREQQKFIALGASGLSGEFNFDAWRINLAGAVGKAGGLIDNQAEPAGVFLYRRETRDVAAALGVDISRFTGETVPIVFSINFRDPGGFFLATKVKMRHQDILYVTNAQSVEVSKFLEYLRIWMATASDAANTVNSGVVLRNNIRALR